ncbi:non-ribosomal peptide synthetase [Dactylosporangium sp. NPDC048998]|uniref:non-ribosomal peptide synthetase n=1 Tax=Dactylosporangium sp. NPDC048998 TaxID=3363976 RepID=UPI003722A65D
MSPRVRNTATPGTVADLIWQRAEAAPDAVAVIDATGTAVTYQQLARRADAVAAELAAAGLAADDVAGVCWPRSVDGLVQLLGVWRAGGAVLYLDPAWPARRLQYMATACAVRHVRAADPAPDLSPPRPPAASAGIGLEPVHGPLCYVVFTSGSTGTPKGVLIEHPGVVTMATALADRFEVRSGTRVLQFAAWSWDAALAEILMTLTAGATLVLAPDSARAGGPALARALREHRVEVATLTPSVLAAVPTDDLPDLRTVVAVGEVCPPRLVERWASPHRRFFNGYGPTETTVAVTAGELHPGQEVHIGAPLPGVTVQIVDTDGRPQPAGAVGEIVVGGIGVARGYAASPAATAARFTTDASGRRWYHTGDLATRRVDGALVYLGRTDDQVKIRGHRLTLGEVEHILTAHPAVRACAVVAVADRLTAHITADPDYTGGPPEADLAGTLHQHAATLLPPHAVPDIHVIAALALTAAGKIDREALRTRAAAAPLAPHDREDPLPGGSLATVLDVVTAALDRPVRPDTDIIDAGGHSLLVAQLCVALSDALGVEVPYVAVALNRTPSGIAAAIDDLAATPSPASASRSAA